MARLLLIKDSGPVIHVVLATDNSDLARGVPPWIAGYAVGESDLVVLLPKFRDQTELLYQLVTGSRTDLEELNRLFSGGENDQNRAYALAGSLVHDVLQRYGSAAGGEILLRVRSGARFEGAFKDVTGLTPENMETEFWQRQRIWSTWVPIIGSSTTLWLAVTALALFAIYRRQRRNREIEERWAKEEEDGDLEH